MHNGTTSWMVQAQPGPFQGGRLGGARHLSVAGKAGQVGLLEDEPRQELGLTPLQPRFFQDAGTRWACAGGGRDSTSLSCCGMTPGSCCLECAPRRLLSWISMARAAQRPPLWTTWVAGWAGAGWPWEASEMTGPKG